jgi:hypothetical protein
MIFEREPLTSILSSSVRGEPDRIAFQLVTGNRLCLPKGEGRMWVLLR